VHDLLAGGRGLREIARHLGWGLHTVQRYARAATWQELADGRWQGPRPSKLDPFMPYLHEHTRQGHGDGIRLFREITARLHRQLLRRPRVPGPGAGRGLGRGQAGAWAGGGHRRDKTARNVKVVVLALTARTTRCQVNSHRRSKETTNGNEQYARRNQS
jgi:hypothetical protein